MNHTGYYFNPQIAAFLPGAEAYCLDKYQVRLSAPASFEGGELFLDETDLKKFLSMLPAAAGALPGTAGKRRSLSSVLKEYGYALYFQGRTIQIPLMPEAVLMSETQTIAAASQREEIPGDYFGVYWHTGIRRFAPYRVYLPHSYDPNGKNPLLIGLHGGGGNPDNIFKNTGDRIKLYAERGGYILLAPDASTNNSTYGCPIPPNGMKGAVSAPTNPKNPENLTEEELKSVSMGEAGLDLVLDLVCRKYAVDPDHFYLMGNSMGGMGTLYYASRHPGKFRRICAQGAVPDMRYFDCSGLRNQPTLFVAGEKDSHGVEYLRDGVRALKEHGIPVLYREVPGGTHSSAWVDVLDEIFTFFEI